MDDFRIYQPEETARALSVSDILEQDSRRYNRAFTEEDEAAEI